VKLAKNSFEEFGCGVKKFFPDLLTAIETQKEVDKRLQWILEACSPVKIILFGSAAKGTMNQNSDLDFIVIFSNEENLKITSQKVLGRKPPHSIPADILFYHLDNFNKRASIGGICFVAAQEGKVMYEAAPIVFSKEGSHDAPTARKTL
jgi:predicted nucleotidyltransferase